MFLSGKSYLHSLKISLIIYVFGNTFRCSMCCLFIYSKPIKYLAVNLGLACSFFFLLSPFFLSVPHELLPRQGFRSSGFTKLCFLPSFLGWFSHLVLWSVLNMRWRIAPLSFCSHTSMHIYLQLSQHPLLKNYFSIGPSEVLMEDMPAHVPALEYVVCQEWR